MKLGWMRIAGATSQRLSQSEIATLVSHGDEIGLRQLHVSTIDLDQISGLPIPGNLRLGLSASALPSHPASAMATALRSCLKAWDGRIVLALPVATSIDTRATTQTIESLFADPVGWQDPNDVPNDTLRPEVLILPSRGKAPDMRRCAASGFHAMSPAWQTEATIARHWTEQVMGATHAMKRARPENWHVARFVYVSEDCAKIAAYRALVAETCMRSYAAPGASSESLVIAGSARYVSERLKSLRANVGPFGVLQVLDPGLSVTEALNQCVHLTSTVVPTLQGAKPTDSKELERI